MVPAGAQVHHQIHVERAARAQKDGRAIGAEARPVGGDQHVRPHRLAMLRTDFAQSRRADLLAGFDQHLEVEAEPAARREHRLDRGEVDRVLPLVVGGAAAVETVAFARQLPGVESGAPLRFLAADDIAMAVGEYRDLRGIFHPLGEQERSALGQRVLEQPAAEPEPLQAGLHLRREIAREFAFAVRILALGGNRDAACQVAAEAALVEITLYALNRVLPAHFNSFPQARSRRVRHRRAG